MQQPGPPPAYGNQVYIPAQTPSVVYHPAPPPAQPNITTNNSNNNSNTINNTVVVGQPGSGTGNNLLVIPKDKMNSRSWTTGKCGCLNDVTSCTIGCLCLPALIARVSNRLGECCLLACLPGTHMALRTKLRTMGGIKGSVWGDCVASWCCLPCVICQMSREMDAMEL